MTSARHWNPDRMAGASVAGLRLVACTELLDEGFDEPTAEPAARAALAAFEADAVVFHPKTQDLTFPLQRDPHRSAAIVREGVLQGVSDKLICKNRDAHRPIGVDADVIEFAFQCHP